MLPHVFVLNLPSQCQGTIKLKEDQIPPPSLAPTRAMSTQYLAIIACYIKSLGFSFSKTASWII